MAISARKSFPASSSTSTILKIYRDAMPNMVHANMDDLNAGDESVIDFLIEGFKTQLADRTLNNLDDMDAVYNVLESRNGDGHLDAQLKALNDIYEERQQQSEIEEAYLENLGEAVDLYQSEDDEPKLDVPINVEPSPVTPELANLFGEMERKLEESIAEDSAPRPR